MTMTMTLMMVNSLRKVPRVVVKSRVKSRVKGRTVRKVMTVRRKRRKMRQMRLGDEAGKKGGDPDYEDGMVRARHLQLRQAKFLLPQPRHRTNYLISVYSACRLQVAPLSQL